MRIGLIYHRAGDIWGYAGPVRDMGGWVRAAVSPDAVRRAFGESLDVLVVHGSLIREGDWSDTPIPLVVIDPMDGSQLCRREQCQWMSVKAIIKRSMLWPRKLQNAYRDRYHVKMLLDAGVKPRRPVEPHRHGKPEPQLTEAELAKVYPLVSFACLPSLKGAMEKGSRLDWAAERPFSVHFAGTVGYSGTVVESHRHAALRAARQAPDPKVAKNGRIMGIKQYRETLRASRCCLSPWGWGETTYRDFEAMLCGAVLVKPPMGHVATWPADLFVPGETFVECGMMFEGAGEIIERIGRDWPRYRKMRQQAFEVACRARDRGLLTERLRQIIEGAMG